MLTFAKLRRELLTILGFCLLYGLVALLVQNRYYQLVMTQVLLWGTLASAWNLLSGYSGLMSFGHAVFWGIGAYTVTLTFTLLGWSPWIGIPLGMLAGILAAVVIGLATFRLRGHYFALAMLAYPQALLYVFEWLGYQEVPLPMRRDAPAAFMQFADLRVYVGLALALLATAMVIALLVERSRFGASLLAIKQNEPAAEAVGVDTWRWKMRAIILSGGIAAAAGGLNAVVLLVVTPDAVFGLLVSAQALILTLFGGIGSLWGPVIGAIVLVPLAETLQGQFGDVLPGIQGVVYGIAIIAIIRLAPEGLYWRLRDRLKRPQSVAAASPSVTALALPQRLPAATSGTLLTLANVSRSFGGLRAVDDVSLTVRAGSIHGIIGPNGAGKTTLFNIINGFLRPHSGSIRFAANELVGLQPNRVCRLGIGRTFQIVRAFPRMSLLDNVKIGAYVGAPDAGAAERLALEALARVGLADQAMLLAGGLTTKQLRLMELARALAPRPRLLLLDETLAGLGHGDLEDVLAVIRRLRDDGATVLIVEHTMKAMLQIADRFSVLDHGRLLAEGPPAEVVRDPTVIEAYLGKRWLAGAVHTGT